MTVGSNKGYLSGNGGIPAEEIRQTARTTPDGFRAAAEWVLEKHISRFGGMMRKKLRFWAGAAFGAAIQYFYDPKAGQARRALLRQKIADRVLDAKDGLAKNGAKAGRIDHLRLWRMEPRRTASRIV